MFKVQIRCVKHGLKLNVFQNDCFLKFSSCCLKEVLNTTPRPLNDFNLQANKLSSYKLSRFPYEFANKSQFYRYYSKQNLKSDEIVENKSTLNQNNDSSFVDSESKLSSNDNDNEADTDLYDDIDYNAIVGEGDDEALNKFKLLLLEVEVLRQSGGQVPDKLSTEEWKQLFALQTKSQRIKFLGFLWKNDIKRLADKQKKERKKIALLEKRAETLKEREESQHILYGFQGSTIFLRIYDTTINFFDNCRLVQAMMFGPNIVIDCGYDADMTAMENRMCAKQLTYLFGENRMHREPFNLHFCNVNRESIMYRQLESNIPKLNDPDFPINLTEKSYLDLFPKEKLVYLTPHCRTELREFNHDDVYIIGALVDKTNQAPLSLAKAKSQGLRMAQLPLDRYVTWHLGGKSLPLNQMISILLDFNHTGDWNKAFKHLPSRKVRQPGQPIKDPRRPFFRGTSYQPPPLFRGRRY